MATTTNFGWETPDDTDLVKDGAAAMRTLGQSIDTSFVDLKGGTSGQMLTKASNTDLDYTWVTPQIGDITSITATSPLTGGGTAGDVTVGIQSGSTTQSGALQLTDSTSSTSTTTAATPNSVKTSYDLANAAIPKSTVTTAGDVIYATGSGAVTRLGIGTAGQVLKVNSGATAPEWGAATGGGMTLLASGSLSGSQTSITSLSSSYKELVVYVISAVDTLAENLCIRVNNDSGSNYGWSGTSSARTTTSQSTSNTKIICDFPVIPSSGGTQGWAIRIPNYTAANYKFMHIIGAGINTGSKYCINFTGMWASTSAITEIDLLPNAGSWSSGTYEVYGVK